MLRFFATNPRIPAQFKSAPHHAARREPQVCALSPMLLSRQELRRLVLDMVD